MAPRSSWALPVEGVMPANGFKRPVSAWLTALFLGVAEVSVLACALAQPAAAQVLDERFPAMEDRARRRPQQQWQQQWQQPQWQQQQQQPSFSPFQAFPDQQQRQPRQVQQAAESIRPPSPAPRRPDAPPPSISVEVFGDSLADWLALGLEDAFAETPEIGILRKNRWLTGLIRVETRNESYDWPQQAKEMLAADKPDYVVMMIGTADRRGIRELIKAAAPRNPAQKATPQQAQKGPATPPQTAQPQQAAPPAADKPTAPATDAEAPPPDTVQQTEETPPAAPDVTAAGSVVQEFRTEKWGELYSKRIDEMIAALKSRGVPVFWVGLPSIRGARATTDMVYLNDLYRARAEKAGITYIDVWDGFVDEGGNFNQFGADFEGQTRRLRTYDGVHFTRPGARKLAHYVEREIRRVMQTRATPMAAIPKEEPDPDVVKGPQAPAKPAASPVMSLTAPTQGGDTLLGAAPPPSASADSVVTRVLVRGEPVEAPPGRADDFTWPRRDVATSTGALPPDPVLPPPTPVVVTPTPVAVAPGMTPRAFVPRPSQPQQQQQQQAQRNDEWWRPFQRQDSPPQQQPQRQYRRDPQQQPFFNWFGR